MLRKLPLPVLLLVLAYGFWVSPDFNQIAAGVAIFLFGMTLLEQGFKAFTGGLLERLLRASTDNLLKSMGFGVVTTTLMQSSSLVSLLAISFLSAGLITLAAGIGIIFGANLGTTTGAWLVAGFGLKVNMSVVAMPALVFGVILMLQHHRHVKGIGYVFAGIGFLFLGIHFMKEGFDAFRDQIDFAAYAVPGYPGLFLYVLIGIIATVVMQSSHATLVLTLTALSAEQVTYDNALALAIGSNVGTTITAIIGSFSGGVMGRRLAGAHLVFNLVTAALALIFIQPLIALVTGISRQLGIAPEDYALQLAVFHSLFNLIGIVVMVPLTSSMVVWLERLFPAEVVPIKRPKYITPSALEVPDIALEALRKEVARLFEYAQKIIAHGLGWHKKQLLEADELGQLLDMDVALSNEDIDEKYAHNIKSIYAEILLFVSQAQGQMLPEQGEDMLRLRGAARHIVDAVKGVKHLQKNLRHYLASDDEEAAKLYNSIRLQIATVLREIDRLRHSDDPEENVLWLDTVEVDMNHADLGESGVLDQMIRDQKVTPDLAASAMKDSGYTREICASLLFVAKVIFSSRDADIRSAERSVGLDHEEIRALSAKAGSDESWASTHNEDLS